MPILSQKLTLSRINCSKPFLSDSCWGRSVSRHLWFQGSLRKEWLHHLTSVLSLDIETQGTQNWWKYGQLISSPCSGSWLSSLAAKYYWRQVRCWRLCLPFKQTRQGTWVWVDLCRSSSQKLPLSHQPFMSQPLLFLTGDTPVRKESFNFKTCTFS